jgi:WD40 repeat protein
MRIWNTRTWQCNHVLRCEEFIHSTAISADGCWLATTSKEKQVIIWNTATGSIQAEMWLDSPVRWLLWLPGSYDLCVNSYDGLNMYTLITA